MSSGDKIEIAKNWFGHSIDSGRMAHAYLLVGPRVDTETFARHILRRLLCRNGEGEDDCPQCRQVDRHEHPDVYWVEPESRSRYIVIDAIRDLNKQMWETSFYGGCKAGVIADADRMNAAAANSFLKTLEEPPQNSIILLLSEHPDELLPTIRSRCQYVSLDSGTEPVREEWGEELLGILRQGSPSEPLYVLKISKELQSIMARERARIEEQEPKPPEDSTNKEKECYAARVTARVLELRHDIVRQMVLWHRDVLMVVLGAPESVFHFPEELAALRKQAEGLSCSAANAILAEAEAIGRRLERQVPDGLIFDDGLMTQAALAFKSRLKAGKSN